MTIYKSTAFYLLLAVLFACNDPDIIGLDLPGSASFTITNDSIENFTIKTISEDSLRSDESQNLLLGQINDPIFGKNKSKFQKIRMCCLCKYFFLDVGEDRSHFNFFPSELFQNKKKHFQICVDKLNCEIHQKSFEIA